MKKPKKLIISTKVKRLTVSVYKAMVFIDLRDRIFPDKHVNAFVSVKQAKKLDDKLNEYVDWIEK